MDTRAFSRHAGHAAPLTHTEAVAEALNEFLLARAEDRLSLPPTPASPHYAALSPSPLLRDRPETRRPVAPAPRGPSASDISRFGKGVPLDHHG